MNRTKLSLLGLALLVPGITGCQSVPRDAGFTDIKQDVTARIGKEVHWNQGAAEDQTVAESIQTMLSKDLSTDDAVQIALLNNRNLQATYQTLGIAQADLVQAGLFRNPRLTGQYLPATVSGPAAVAGIDLAINFLDFFYVPLRKRIAASRFEEAKRIVASEVLSVAGNTRLAYYDLQHAEQILELHKAVLDAMMASSNAMARLHEAGNVTDTAVEQERDARDQAKLNLAKAEASVVRAREALVRLMGLWGAQAEGWRIQKHLPELSSTEGSPEGLEKKAVQANLTLAANRERIEALARQAGFSTWEAVLPEIEMGPVSDREDNATWHIGPGLTIPLPIFDQGQARHAAAQARLRQAFEWHAATAVEVRSLARQTWHRVETAHATARFLQKVVLPRRERIVSNMQKEYNAMQIGVFQLLEFKRNEIQAGVDYVDSLHEYWSAKAELDLLLAGFARNGNSSPSLATSNSGTKE